MPLGQSTRLIGIYTCSFACYYVVDDVPAGVAVSVPFDWVPAWTGSGCDSVFASGWLASAAGGGGTGGEATSDVSGFGSWRGTSAAVAVAEDVASGAPDAGSEAAAATGAGAEGDDEGPASATLLLEDSAGRSRGADPALLLLSRKRAAPMSSLVTTSKCPGLASAVLAT